VANRLHLAALVCGLLIFSACKSARRSENSRPQVGWRPIVAFSGRGDSQTESFDISSAQWRIKWQTQGAASPSSGTFHVVVHSAVSGRPLDDAVYHRGNGSGIAYVADDPRLYHLVIDSSGVDWSIQVQEAVVGVAESSR
jgi:hypothetical protein